jgi:alpha-mannosidase
MPPNDTYGSDLNAGDLAKSERQHAEKGVSNTSVTLFGFSDGGGGPTPEMLAAAHRLQDLEGSPRLRLGSPTEFFDAAKAAAPALGVWSGEMYAEFHRGTYTSQAKTKLGNRRSEHLLREAELWSATASARGLLDYPYEQLDEIWHTVLLQQFHDILPGSAIAWVHQEAEENYARIAVELEALIANAQRALAGSGESNVSFNAAPVGAGTVAPLGAMVVSVSAAGVTPLITGSGITLENAVASVRFSEAGLLESFVDRASGRELIAPGETGAHLQIFRDIPNLFEAWDLDRSYQNSWTDLTRPVSVHVDGDTVEVSHEYGASRIVQRFRLLDDSALLHIEVEADWHEEEKLLKLGFPLDLRTDTAASEVQFGHVQRPTYVNTSWDAARFETVAHRWVHVAEPGFGVVVANASTYGHDVSRSVRPDGGTTTLVRQSLLRAPRYPDPHADRGHHTFHTTFGPAVTILDAATAGYQLNLPVRSIADAAGDAVEPIVTVPAPSVLVESVKLAEDRSGDLIVRLYEAEGRRVRTPLHIAAPVARAWRTDLLERELGTASWGAEETVTLEVRPFEIVTIRVHLRRDA